MIGVLRAHLCLLAKGGHIDLICMADLAHTRVGRSLPHCDPDVAPRARRFEDGIGQNLAPLMCFVVIELADSFFEETERRR